MTESLAQGFLDVFSFFKMCARGVSFKVVLSPARYSYDLRLVVLYVSVVMSLFVLTKEYEAWDLSNFSLLAAGCFVLSPNPAVVCGQLGCACISDYSSFSLVVVAAMHRVDMAVVF